MASIESEWPDLLGKSYDTLNALTHGKGIGDVASNFFVEMYHPEEILKDKEKRNILVGVMPEDYAIDLAQKLNLEYSSVSELYQKLRNITFNSNVKKIFMDYFGIEPEIKCPEKIIEGVEVLDNTRLEYPLRDYQRQVLSQVESIFQNGSRRCMIQMPTGSGKTRTAMYQISEMMNSSECYLVLWLAYNRELCDQAADEFSKVWKLRGNKRSTIYRFYGSSNCVIPSSKSNGIIITTLSKIQSARKSDITFLSMLADKIDLVVFDEAHQIVAPTYESIVKEVINLNSKTKLIGLSATPGRTWDDPEEDYKLSNFFYHNIARIETGTSETPNQMLTRLGFLSKINWIFCNCQTPTLTESDCNLIKNMREDEEFSIKILEKMSVDAVRNTKIMSAVRDLLIDDKKRILIFSTSVEHARLLTGLLKIVSKDFNCTVNCITGETESGLREEIIDNFRSSSDLPQIICNYNVLTTGFDAPNIDAGVIARPTKSLVLFSQMVGRMIRGPMTVGGTAEASIVSVVDWEIPGFKDAYDNWVDVWQ